MRAVRYEGPGAAGDVLRLVEMETPAPAPGEVLVRVRFSGVNPTDWKSRTRVGMVVPWQIPNQDGAGTIVGVGAGVDPARVGQRVWLFHCASGRQYGTAADFTCVPEGQAVPLPDSISMQQGAGLGIPYITAHGCLFAGGDISGSTILVTGGAGAVGHAAIELAHRAGARVIATVSSAEKAAIASAAGADVVLNYRVPGFLDDLRAAATHGVDRVVDVAIGANLVASLSVLRPHGVIVSYATEESDPTIPVRQLMTGNVTLAFVVVYGFTPQAIGAAVGDISAALAEGTLGRLPEHLYSLEDTASAHDAVEAGALGKVLIDLGE